jgi:hypothetical protein
VGARPTPVNRPIGGTAGTPRPTHGRVGRVADGRASKGGQNRAVSVYSPKTSRSAPTISPSVA